MFSNDKNVETIGQLVEVLKHYIGLQSEYMKLDVVDKVVRLLPAIAAAYGLAGLIGSTALAFCVVAGVYLFILILFIIFRHQWIERPLVKFLASILMQ